MTPKEILIAARSVIENPENWTQGAYCRTSTGRAVGYHSREARCFCSIGAVMKAWPSGSKEAYDLLHKATPDGNILKFNDEHSHQEVLAAFDRAIASA